ncbi:MAG: CapA family protein [Lachnospiraceae bacterium]|nr:CapA family protein [Lachnospiraceae bacterium]
MRMRKIITAYVMLAALTLTGCSNPIAPIEQLMPDGGLAVPQKEEEPKQEAEETGSGQSQQEDAKEDLPVITIVDDSEPVDVSEKEESGEEAEGETGTVYEDIYDPVGKEYSVEAADKDRVTLAFVGDVGFAQGYATINKYRSNGSDIHKSISDGVLSIMQSVDIMMANNEFPYSDRGTPTPNKTYTFRADPKDVHIMKDMGVDIVSLANNHAYDYGPEALIDTIDTLNDARLPFAGAGKNIEEASKPVYFHVNGHVISYVSATQIERYGNPDTKEATKDSPGVLRTLDPAKAVAVIKEAASKSDFTVMYVHWGSESTDLVEQSQRELAAAYADAGADLIIGDHSHCLQGIDYVKGVPVFYSLGNFWFNSKTLDTCIVKVTLDEDCAISEIEFIPCIQRGSGVTDASESERGRIIEYMRGISNYADIDDKGFVTKSDTDHNIQKGQNTSPARKSAEPAVPEGEPQLTEPAGEGEAGTVQPAQESPQAPAQNAPDEQLPDWAVDVQ